MLVEAVCESCGEKFERPKGQLGRCKHTYCSQSCVGVARRKDVSAAEKKAAKAEYDREYRAKNLKRITKKKAEYVMRTYTPERGREVRDKAKKRLGDDYHTKYCRKYYSDPEKKAAKVEYDRQRRAAQYGEFSECWLLLLELEREIRSRQSGYERRKARGYYTRTAQQRRRDAQISRH